MAGAVAMSALLWPAKPDDRRILKTCVGARIRRGRKRSMALDGSAELVYLCGEPPGPQRFPGVEPSLQLLEALLPILQSESMDPGLHEAPYPKTESFRSSRSGAMWTGTCSHIPFLYINQPVLKGGLFFPEASQDFSPPAPYPGERWDNGMVFLALDHPPVPARALTDPVVNWGPAVSVLRSHHRIHHVRCRSMDQPPGFPRCLVDDDRRMRFERPGAPCPAGLAAAISRKGRAAISLDTTRRTLTCFCPPGP